MEELDYNVRYVETAQEFLKRLYCKEEHELRCLHRAKGLQNLVSCGVSLLMKRWDVLRLHGYHVTTQPDECCGIRENGLKPLPELLTEDYPLGRAVRDAGIVFDFDSQSIYVKNGSEARKLNLSRFDNHESRLLLRLDRDAGISAFLSCPSYKEYGIEFEKQPEILRTLSYVLEKPVASDWCEKTKPFIVHFRVSLNAVDLEAMADCEELEYNLKECVCEGLLNIAFRRAAGHIEQTCLFLADNTAVSPVDILEITELSDENDQVDVKAERESEWYWLYSWI